MELKCFRTLWGVTTPWPQTLDELQRVGCCGIEARVPLTVAERRQLADRLQASGLEYIAILFSGGGVLPAQHETPEQHLARLQTRFAEASG
ncbi:TPA: sugar phosphate isomerase/epimerase, partial [Klebsiella pneumoniae]|nr:sugar phosphate isomerase/epimerase [Klebsiella pneumoniae]HBS2977853.1 sugar phosphate isomerase/epimerase [Klebsiella pneumoniae]HBU5826160.1 sugar phosphate isomerase/epimerase [Klebsiella pneumoniae]HBV3593012.1 sugar phosphate isomerase/epimerase [Klebsiella pneumoniae]HBW2203819.1 sugar phosphate isomerase/epimerase [Klebsiella pneumoniae]